MTNQHTDPGPTTADEISLRDIATALGRRKRLIGGVLAVCTLLGLLYAIFTTPLYTATVTVQPAVDEGGSPLSGLGGGLGEAAALAGVNIGGGGTQTERYLAILRSRELGKQFIKEHELMPYLFRARWNADEGKWRVGGEPGIKGSLTRWISRTLADLSGDQGWSPPSSTPTLAQAYDRLDGIRSVSNSQDSSIVTVSFEFRDPKLAAEWANAYVAMANERIREETVREASRALDYLNDEVQKTQMAGLRETIFNLVEAQLERVTLTNARPEYAFQVIDQAVIPQSRSHPDRKLILVLSLVLGSMLGVFAALAIEVWRGGLISKAEVSVAHGDKGIGT